MAVRFMSFAHWNPDWAGAACGLGAACAGALALAGYGELALALLAGIGAACWLLLAAGQLHFGRRENPADARLSEILKATPAAVAVTGRDGRVLWRSSAFAAAVAGSGADQDLSRLGERQPETAAAVFRLFSAARKGQAREEDVALLHRKTAGVIRLKVSAFSAKVSRPQYLVWQIEEPQAGLAAESASSGLLDTLPVPALIIAKDLSVEAANKSFETLLGGPAAGTEAWILFRTKRGKPFTRPWLRDVIAKAQEPVPVQIGGADGVFRPALLHCAIDRA